jgi:hypothetical protein
MFAPARIALSEDIVFLRLRRQCLRRQNLYVQCLRRRHCLRIRRHCLQDIVFEDNVFEDRVFEDNVFRRMPGRSKKARIVFTACAKTKKLIVNVYDNVRNCPFSRYLAVFLDVPGHKLQGKSQHSLYINAWSYTKNWPYVMLSRVTTRQGLFLAKPLDPTKDYSVDPLYTHMIRAFRSKQPSPYNEHQN